jgi:hypothetical protein
MINISEFQPKNYREFYSMSELVRTIGRTMKVMSWGAHAWTKMNKALLRFKVEARRHKGHIYIAVNGADLFDVFLTSVQGRIIKEFHDVFIEDLISTIDNEIERIPEYNR